ncbi:MAG: radical SAM protein, partial [Nanoarchaeota archaeon]|nr:radical SAM protein [Nanoarchaeota archaeon]
EWKKVLESVGTAPFWVTLSGGEPFLRKDFVRIVRLVSVYNKPRILNIATNGILTDKIISDVKKILKFYKNKLIINISLDGTGKEHNRIRGVENNFKKTMDTFSKLKSLKKYYKNLRVGLHTVISKYNVKEIPKIFEYVQGLKTDSFLTEIAENRKELENLGESISPKVEDYFDAVDFLLKEQKDKSLINVLRKKYYKLTKKVLKEKKETIRCYAGLASAHISSEGKLWACCMYCKELGDLKKHRFNEVWNSGEANKVREDIKKNRCFCTLANVAYSNMLCSPVSSLFKIHD